MSAVLETRNLDKRFGGIVAASAISIAIRKGARHALIGPNGAGKTTFVNLLTGVLRPSGGEILLDGASITNLEPHRRVRPPPPNAPLLSTDHTEGARLSALHRGACPAN